MTAIRRRLDDDSGFTLVELIAALSIFTLAAASLLLLLVGGIQTAGIARDRTIAKDLARQRLEEMRRLPFYQSYATFPRKADLLDTYFADASGAAYVTSADSDRCGTASTCPRYTVTENPVTGYPRYRIDVTTRFINQDLTTVTPPSGYRWDSASADRPPARLLAVDITVSWGTNKPRNFVLRSQLGEARLEDVVVQGSATGTVVRIDTAFSDSSTLLVEAGKGTSSVFVGNVSSARNETTAAAATVTQDNGDVSTFGAARAVAGSPPDVAAPPASDPGSSLEHPNASLNGLLTCGTILRCVATIGPSLVENVSTTVTATPPAATGELTLRTGPESDDGGQPGITATNEVDGTDYRKLDSAKEFVRVRKTSGPLRPAYLQTSCAQLTSTTDCSATGKTSELRMIPVTFGSFDTTNGYLVTARFSDLTAHASARRAGASGTGAATTTFCGTVTYWSWNGSDWVNNSLTVTNTPGTCGTAGALPDPSTVPLGTVDGRALFLSDYISSWSALVAGTTTVSADQKTAEAVLDGVLRITTTPTNETLPNSGFIVRVGNVRAQAVDNR